MKTNHFSEKFQGGIDPAKLENVKHLHGGGTRAACPACRASGSDKSGDHLLIKLDGKFGCAAHPNDREHRKVIYRSGRAASSIGTGAQPTQSSW